LYIDLAQAFGKNVIGAPVSNCPFGSEMVAVGVFPYNGSIARQYVVTDGKQVQPIDRQRELFGKEKAWRGQSLYSISDAGLVK